MFRFPAAERIERPWEVGDEVCGLTLLFGVVPFSKHRLMVESIDDDQQTIVSDERGGPIRIWRHEIVVTGIDEHRCSYEDRIQIDAGVLTPLVAAYAKVFYRYRQRRWHLLAPLLAATAISTDQISPAHHSDIAETTHT